MTLGLLVLGIFGMFVSISVLTAIPQAVQMLYSQGDLGTYTAAPSVAGLITAGSIAQVLTWLATASVTILLLVRRRRAFYVPLVGAVVSFVAIFIFLTIALTTDPALLDFYSRP